MRNMWRKQKHITLFDMDINIIPALLGLQRYVSFKLVKQFFAILKVIILTRIRSANNHHDIVTITLVNLLVSNGWFQKMPVVINPFFQVEGLRDRHEF